MNGSQSIYVVLASAAMLMAASPSASVWAAETVTEVKASDAYAADMKTPKRTVVRPQAPSVGLPAPSVRPQAPVPTPVARRAPRVEQVAAPRPASRLTYTMVMLGVGY